MSLKHFTQADFSETSAIHRGFGKENLLSFMQGKKKKILNGHRKQTCGCQGGGGGGEMEWEVGVSRCKLLYIGRINNKVLLHSTGNYMQYPIRTIVEKIFLCDCTP